MSAADFEIDLDEEAAQTALHQESTPEYETFGQYKIVGVIAHGGMAELTLALRETERGFRQVVALKRVLPAVANAEGFAEMFVDEARLMGRLEHPNIVRVFDFGEVNGALFLAMEYLAGEDLQRILRRLRQLGQAMPVPIAVTLAREVAGALSYAHGFSDEAGQPLHLVHRDVSPSNIILTYQGATKLIDFGIAKSRQTQTQTTVGAVKGKLAYVAPETFISRTVDAQTDVYALGCVLAELLTGTRLFAAEFDAALIHAILEGPLPDLRAMAPDVDPELIGIVERATARNRAERYQSAEQLEAALDHYLSRTGQTLTSRAVGQWLTELAGSDRASAKQAVAAGTQLSLSVPKVMRAVNRSSSWRPSQVLQLPPPTPTPITGFLALIAAILVVCVVGLVWLKREPALVSFESDPSAKVFVDGAEVTSQWSTTPGTHIVQWSRDGRLTTKVMSLRDPLALKHLTE